MLVTASLVPVGVGVYALRRRLLPRWDGAPARLAEAVLAISTLIVVAQVLGLFGLLSVVPVVIACVGAGLGLRTVARRVGAPEDEPTRLRVEPERLPRALAIGAVAVVVAAWATRLLPALDEGILGADTLWYHLPQAARFAQEGSITHIQFFETGAGTAFYPAVSGLFHTLGMLWLGSDFASPFLNFGWLGLVFLAAWCLGRPYGLGTATTVGAAVLLVTPIMVETQPGGAYNDIVGLAFFLAAAALLVNAGTTGRGGVLAALAAAPALGTKLSLVVPLIALTVGAVAVTGAARRVRVAGTWLAALLGLGGLWYARNLVAFGNPVPAFDLDLGPLSLPSPPLTNLTFSLVHYADTPGVVGDTFLPGLLDGYGPAWWALLALAVAGMVGAAVTGTTRVERMLGVVAIASLLGFLVTPQGLGTEDDPVFFKFNLRYPTPALMLGLCLLPLAPALRHGARRWIAPGAFAAVLAVTQLDPTIWPTDLRDGGFASAPSDATALGALAVGVGFLLALGAIALVLRGRPGAGLRTPRGLLAAGAAGLLLVVSAGWLVERSYLRDRYEDFGPMPRVARWASDEEGARIAIVGFFVQYPLYGKDLSNRVDYLAHHGPHGAFTPFQTCREWRRALADGGYDYVVTTPFNYPGSIRRDAPPEARWTGSDPAARLVLRDRGVVSLFRLDGPPDPDGCGES